MRTIGIFVIAATFLAACESGFGGGGSKTDMYVGYAESGPINDYSTDAIQLRQLDMINALRSEEGMRPVQLNSALTSAAATQGHDAAVQQRAWNFGSDASSPQSRAEKAGFVGTVTGENIAETYRGELEVMKSWRNSPMARKVMLDSSATHVGIAFVMEGNGKVWWVQDFGALGLTQARTN